MIESREVHVARPCTHLRPHMLRVSHHLLTLSHSAWSHRHLSSLSGLSLYLGLSLRLRLSLGLGLGLGLLCGRSCCRPSSFLRCRWCCTIESRGTLVRCSRGLLIVLDELVDALAKELESFVGRELVLGAIQKRRESLEERLELRGREGSATVGGHSGRTMKGG